MYIHTRVIDNNKIFNQFYHSIYYSWFFRWVQVPSRWSIRFPSTKTTVFRARTPSENLCFWTSKLNWNSLLLHYIIFYYLSLFILSIGHNLNSTSQSQTQLTPTLSSHWNHSISDLCCWAHDWGCSQWRIAENFEKFLSCFPNSCFCFRFLNHPTSYSAHLGLSSGKR